MLLVREYEVVGCARAILLYSLRIPVPDTASMFLFEEIIVRGWELARANLNRTLNYLWVRVNQFLFMA